jgi:carbon monoxide dehydrogenase subunit G
MVVQINTSFEVPVSRDRAWEVLLDVEGIAPCMPGATLDGRDGERYLGRVKLKIGPISAQYSGAVTITETDAEAGRLKLLAKGKEQRGTGHAEGTVLALLTETSDGTTRVDVETTLNITGRAAQFGRSVMQDVAKKLVKTFADNLAAQLRTPAPADPGPESQEGAADAADEPPATQPVPGDPATEEPHPATESRTPTQTERPPTAAESPHGTEPQAAVATDSPPPTNSEAPETADSPPAARDEARETAESSPATRDESLETAEQRASATPQTPVGTGTKNAVSPAPLPSAPPVRRPAAVADDINVLALLASSPRVRIGIGVLIALIVVVVVWLVL